MTTYTHEPIREVDKENTFDILYTGLIRVVFSVHGVNVKIYSNLAFPLLCLI